MESHHADFYIILNNTLNEVDDTLQTNSYILSTNDIVWVFCRLKAYRMLKLQEIFRFYSSWLPDWVVEEIYTYCFSTISLHRDPSNIDYRCTNEYGA